MTSGGALSRRRASLLIFLRFALPLLFLGGVSGSSAVDPPTLSGQEGLPFAAAFSWTWLICGATVLVGSSVVAFGQRRWLPASCHSFNVLAVPDPYHTRWRLFAFLSAATQSDLDLRFRITSEAATLGLFRSLRRSGSDYLWLVRSLPQVVGCRLVVGYADVACALSPHLHPHSVLSPSLGSPAQIVASVDGLALHLSARSVTGYEGVSFHRSRPSRPYRAKARGGKLLGDFAAAVDAAVCYARHLLASGSRPIPVASSYVCPISGDITQLRLSSRSSTGYWGVQRLPRSLTRPFVARLGPSATDVVGHFDSAVTAAVAVARALDARDAFIADADLLADAARSTHDVGGGDSMHLLSPEEFASWLAHLPT